MPSSIWCARTIPSTCNAQLDPVCPERPWLKSDLMSLLDSPRPSMCATILHSITPTTPGLPLPRMLQVLKPESIALIGIREHSLCELLQFCCLQYYWFQNFVISAASTQRICISGPHNVIPSPRCWAQPPWPRSTSTWPTTTSSQRVIWWQRLISCTVRNSSPPSGTPTRLLNGRRSTAIIGILWKTIAVPLPGTLELIWKCTQEPM